MHEAPPASPLSSADLLREARAAAADRALRKQHPGRGIRAPIETAQMKLERGIVHAGEMAPNKWHQAPKLTTCDEDEQPATKQK